MPKRVGFDHGYTSSMGWSAVAPEKWGESETPRPAQLSKPIHQKNNHALVNADVSCQGPMFGSRRQINLHRQNLHVHHQRYEKEYLDLRKTEKKQLVQQKFSPRQPRHTPRMQRTQKRGDAPQVIKIPKVKTYSPRFQGSALDRGYKKDDWQSNQNNKDYAKLCV